MKRILPALFLIISIFSNAQSKDFVLGKTETFHSNELNEERALNIYLPAGYDSTQAYPVIYLLDGSADEDFIHIAGLVQYGNYDWIKMVSKSILVGISNVDRKRDFTFPTTIEQDKKDFPTTGSSAKFIAFIEKELQPFIENKYKTSESKTIIGQSLGGLLATEILFKKPSLFTNYIIISPSIWWDNESLFKVNPKFLQADFSQKTKVFVGVGAEGRVMENDAKKLFRLLGKQNRTIESHFHFFKESNHADILHEAVYKAFQTLKI
ncbi:alpha/beta hydrolase-fold protein [Flavobacterium amniphilum]|uniref:alpha/beta hydrolase n=1 Tax=Flavobacterium amniphilum TaxID=1834035 RepID=UPI00202A06D6|nr:alpha/beta hydrolase-fold protein [Flavobacterium amniphilum]MCL9805656.1 alpha/beta hydrolase-fold protein [Flavobacterium amniphilum]